MTKAVNAIYQAFVWAVSTVLVVIALFLVATIVPGMGGYKAFIVRSGSMEPAIKTGSVIIVKPAENYAIGDIITFRNGGQPDDTVTHRVFSLQKSQGKVIAYETKGDANNKEDGNSVRFAEIFGKAVLAVPYVGYGVAAAREPVGFVFIILIPAAIIILDELRKIWVEARRLFMERKAE
jgi:signal peptidase